MSGTADKTMGKLAGAELPVLVGRIALPPEPAAAIEGCTEVSQALARLTGAGHLIEASRLIAHALPKREAVWWACMCARHTAPAELPEADRLAIEAAEEWVRKQDDGVRRVAMAQAQKSGFGTPEAWAGVGAFWSGDSVVAADQQKVPPAPQLTGTAVAGAVALAAVRGDAKRVDARLKRFLKSAEEIAGGGAGRLPPEPA